MKIFIDTSSLFKLYHKEEGTEELMAFLRQNTIEKIYLSELTMIEFDAVVWKKFRKNEIDKDKVDILINNFEKDWIKFTFIKDNNQLKLNARKLIARYGKDGLRSLDAIQLASAVSIKSSTDIFISDDKLLVKLLMSENLKVL